MDTEHEDCPYGEPQDGPEPVDDVTAARDWLYEAARFRPEDLNPFERAMIAATQAQTHALLALNDTVSQLSVRQALRTAAALSSIAPRPGDVEGRLWEDLFPGHSITQRVRSRTAAAEQQPDTPGPDAADSTGDTPTAD